MRGYEYGNLGDLYCMPGAIYYYDFMDAFIYKRKGIFTHSYKFNYRPHPEVINDLLYEFKPGSKMS
jgi:hypothetical protein